FCRCSPITYSFVAHLVVRSCAANHLRPLVVSVPLLRRSPVGCAAPLHISCRTHDDGLATSQLHGERAVPLAYTGQNLAGTGCLEHGLFGPGDAAQPVMVTVDGCLLQRPVAPGEVDGETTACP